MWASVKRSGFSFLFWSNQFLALCMDLKYNTELKAHISEKTLKNEKNYLFINILMEKWAFKNSTAIYRYLRLLFILFMLINCNCVFECCSRILSKFRKELSICNFVNGKLGATMYVNNFVKIGFCNACNIIHLGS